MKKIVLVGNTSWCMVKFRYNLMEELSKRYDLYVIASFDDSSNEIKKINCTYIDVKIENKGSNPLKDIRLTYKLFKIYREINPDLIIHYTIKPNIYGSFATIFSGHKSFSVITGLGYVFINNNIVSKIAKTLYKAALIFSDKVLFINNDDKDEFVLKKFVKEEKTFVIPSEGININVFNPIINIKKDEKFRFLLIARMLWDKGVGEYLEASRILLEKYPHAQFGLLGYADVDNPKAITQEQISIWQKQKNIKFYGSTNDVPNFISKSDCIVLPSYREGKGMVLIEACSMEKPVIATDVVGCRDVVDDGVNGFLCEVKNPKDLSEKMEKMLNLSENERIKMGKLGREKIVKEFDEQIVIAIYIKIIEEII